jgi:hypothetical protein
MISQRQGAGDKEYYTNAPEAVSDADKDSALIL